MSGVWGVLQSAYRTESTARWIKGGECHPMDGGGRLLSKGWLVDIVA